MINFKQLEELNKKPLTQCSPMHLKRALVYCVDYIEIAQRNGCTTFDEFVQRMHGFEPLGELLDKNKIADSQTVVNGDIQN
jgi:hypothetical protein